MLKQPHAAQNDVKGSSKFQKENVEKVQTQGASSQPVKSSMQLPPKKGQNLPPPPPLKASTVLAISTFHPPRVFQDNQGCFQKEVVMLNHSPQTLDLQRLH